MAVLADAEVKVLPSGIIRLEMRRRLRRSSSVLFDGPRSADPPRNHGMFCARTFSTLPEASRPAMPFGSAGNTGRLRSQPRGVRAAASGRFRRRVPDTGRGKLRRARSIPGAHFSPRVPIPSSKCSYTPSRHQELRVFRPSVGTLGKPDLLVAQRLAVSFGGVLFMRRAVADMAVQNDQGRTAGVLRGTCSEQCSMRSISFASLTRKTFQPYARKRIATSSEKAMLVWPSIVIRLLS